MQVLSVQRARARRFAVVAVLGLTEGEFPGHSDPPSLLTGVQRARLDSLGGGGLFVPETNQEAALFRERPVSGLAAPAAERSGR